MMNLIMISPHYPPLKSGLSDYSFQLERELKKNHNVDVLHNGNLTDKWTSLGLLKLLKYLSESKVDKILIQYTPNMYNPRGGINFIFPLVVLLSKILFKKEIYIYFHEVNYPYQNTFKSLVLFISHRIQAKILVKSAKKIFCSSKVFIRLFKREFKKEAKQIPVGSNILVQNRDVNFKFSEIDMNAKSLLLFGKFHDSKLFDRAYEVCFKKNIQLIHLGIEKNEVPQKLKKYVRENFHYTGFLKENEISQYLQIGFPLYSLFVDGASTRRGTMIAGIVHGARVLTNLSKNSDDIFKELKQCQCLNSIGELDSFVENNLKFFERKELCQDGNEFFSWSTISKALISEIS